MKFRKKPIVIEAIQVKEALIQAKNDRRSLPSWLREAYHESTILFLDDYANIHTLEGWLLGRADDWIIRGVKGELYPCKPDVFEETYEPVE